ncbi:MAG: aminotransferase class I/II-fold pyridoxal phosphate-dependent enzyme [Selenomonadaceae bacterium]|nr:aminotransferase class I/II-fold pyridoxal phosphate-dependent enzyme [Selenomonadaceae bacterium]
MKFAKRMEPFGENIFAKLAAVKKQKIAAGRAVIDLSVGAPNIAPPREVMQTIAEEAMKPENYLYAITDRDELLEAASDWYQSRYGVTLDPKTEICSLMGSQEGLSHIALSIVDAGGMTLVPDPCYPVFADGPKIAESEVFYMPMKKENDYLIQFDVIPEEVARKARLMIVSYPNNPTTALAPDSWYEELIAFAKKYDIIVLHDNAYSELVFDGNTCGSFLRFPGAKEVGIEFNSLSKTYGMAGARVGFCVGNAEVVAHLKTLKSNMDYGMFLPVQKAAITALRSPRSNVEATRRAYEERRDALVGGLKAIGWKMDMPKSTMFVWAPIPEPYTDSIQFTLDLLDRSDVMVTPGSAFGPSGEGFVRMALVQDPDVLARVVENVKASGLFA